MKPNPNVYYDFSPLLPDGSGERQYMRITEADLYRLPYGRRKQLVTVFDLITQCHYAVQFERGDHHLVAPSDHGRAA